MNKMIDQSPRRARPIARALLLAGGATLVLAACNSLTGVNDLNVNPNGVNGAAGTGGTGPTGGTGGGAGTDTTGGSGSGGVNGTGTGPIGTPCANGSVCSPELVCVFGACRAPCTSDADAACAESSCLTNFTLALGGCRTVGDVCNTPGEVSGELVCGPDKVLRMGCAEGTKICRSGQTCISGTCIGETEKNTPWGKCGKQGKSCVKAKLSICDVGQAGGRTEDCPSEAICLSSVPGPGAACVTCGATEKKCQVDATTKQISGAVCNVGQTGFDITECKGATSQCNPSLGICQKIAIDENEVTQAQYRAFLVATADAVTGKIAPNDKIPNACIDNDLRPNKTCIANAKPAICDFDDADQAKCAKHPVTCVDWCDAFSYCALQGKKLCGKIGGGIKDNLPMPNFADPGASEWSNACTAGGRFVFATDTDGNYESAPDKIGQLCNGKDKGQNPDPPRLTLPVDDPGLAFCKHQTSGYPAKNLLGNVREWESSCATPAFEQGASLTDQCRVRGGSYRTNDDDDAKKPLDANAMRCDYDEKELRGNAYPDVGFRCCDL